MVDVKELVGRTAADYVESGMVVGLGTGSTAFWFVDEIGRRLRSGQLEHIVAVPTSKRTAEQARMLRIPLASLDEVSHIDVLVDGADECTPTFSGIKGGGGALLHEKIVAQSSHKRIWIVGEDKLVDALGAFPLPVEVVPFGSWKLFRMLDQAGLNPMFRKKDGDSFYRTDSDNYIIDLHLKHIPNPQQLAFDLNNMVGVVDHGLFLNHPHVILVGKQDGTIERYER